MMQEARGVGAPQTKVQYEYEAKGTRCVGVGSRVGVGVIRSRDNWHHQGIGSYLQHRWRDMGGELKNGWHTQAHCQCSLTK